LVGAKTKFFAQVWFYPHRNSKVGWIISAQYLRQPAAILKLG
jgi:hypothetical protein